jgi:DNA-binding response OmpR family regulator
MILIIDDEIRRFENYIYFLKKAGYEVKIIKNVDAALEFIYSNLDSIKLLILDIMMSPGNTFTDEETQYGLRTGIPFYRKIRERSKDMPIMVLTNVTDWNVSELFKGEKNCWFYTKEKCLPSTFPAIVQEIAGQ